MRSPAGEEMVLAKNVFVERILPASVLRGLTAEEMERYREPFREPGESRRPTLTWPREIPVDGEPADVTALVDDYADVAGPESRCPSSSSTANPGSILVGAPARVLPDLAQPAGSHGARQPLPAGGLAGEIGQAIARFLRRL